MRSSNSFKARAGLLLIFTTLALFFIFRGPSQRNAAATRYVSKPGTTNYVPKVAKVSMLYGDPNKLYVRALESHKEHNERWHYDMHILKQNMLGNYWNKPFWIQNLIVQELAKNPEDRIEWLMWVDADLILINPSLPLEIFLPPEEFSHIHFLGNKDQNGLNTGTFFIRVHEWSIKMLAKAIAYPVFRPDVDLHVSADQEAMAHVFNESEFSPHIMFQPRIWYNTYEFHHGYEGKPGNLLVHFPGLEEDRWPHMQQWLDRLEETPSEWDIPAESTEYPKLISEYWDIMKDSYTTLTAIDQEYTEKLAQMAPHIQEAFDRAWATILYEADEPATVEEATKALKLVWTPEMMQ